MVEYLTEDEVRETAGKILSFTKIKNVQCGVLYNNYFQKESSRLGFQPNN